MSLKANECPRTYFESEEIKRLTAEAKEWRDRFVMELAAHAKTKAALDEARECLRQTMNLLDQATNCSLLTHPLWQRWLKALGEKK